MPETIFSKILRAEIPCHKIYETERVLAFLDIAPLAPGHMLLIPKETKATLGELSDESAAALGAALPRLCRAAQAATGTSACNVLQNNGALANQLVQHVHFHIIPKPNEEEGLRMTWRGGKLDAAMGAALAEALVRALAQ